MKYKVTIKQINPPSEEGRYDRETEIYEQTVDELFIDSVIGAVNSFPVQADEIQRRNKKAQE